MNIADYITIISFIAFVLLIIVIIVTFIILYFVDRRQLASPVLRNYPVLGRMRYFFEKVGPEMRQYWFHNNREGKPFSRNDYEHIVKSAKYKRDVVGFGSERDFEEAGYYVRNAMFPKLASEMKLDRDTFVKTNRYLLLKDPLFSQRVEVVEEHESKAYLLADDDAIVIGPKTRQPFVVKGLIGMSAMSYGSLGKRAITALSEGLAMAKGTWMNSGEGGLSPYHLKGGVDIIFQIGPGLFGVRDEEGNFDWEELKKKNEISEIKAYELKFGQGAKVRGGHVDGEKVTPEIAEIRGVVPWQSIDSPNRFPDLSDYLSVFAKMDKIREVTGKPVGMKIVIGAPDEAEKLAKQMKELGTGPDFITIDGGEGGTGASYQELADSVGLPIQSALPLLDSALRKYEVRDRVKIIASGKMFSPDRIAIALAMGADLVNIARGFMITVGCIQTLKCHSNDCPVGVATTDPELEKALVIDEKKHRVANYLITLREGLFRISAAAGLQSPNEFSRKDILYKDEKGVVSSLDEIYRSITQLDHPHFPKQ